MNCFALEPNFAVDVVMPDEFLESMRLWRMFADQRPWGSTSAPRVSVQKRSRRGPYMSFLRNAPALSERGAQLISELAGEAVALIPLQENGQPLFALNVVERVPESGTATSPPIFKLEGRELDCIFATEDFQRRSEAAGLGICFTAPSRRHLRRGPQSWGLPAALGLRDLEASATEEQVSATEVRTGLRFPESLRWLFLNANGGSLADDSAGIAELSALREGRGSAEWTYAVLVVERGLVPWTFFPFGHDGGGNTFFVDCDSPQGRVFLHLHDTAYENLLPFQEPLSEFVSRLSRSA